jgi:flagellar hook-length control protein FliK
MPMASKGVPLEVKGNVVPGAMSEDRLTSEALMNLGSAIRELKNSNGGEVKIRLNPEHLGELKVKVATHGNQVSLSIDASSEDAKRVLESSLDSLKEQLHSKQLTLSHFDIQSQTPTTGRSDFQFSSSDMTNNFGQDLNGFDSQGSQSAFDRGSQNGNPSLNRNQFAPRASLASIFGSAQNQQAKVGRLNVVA